MSVEARRELVTAEVFSIGTELTVGDTRDTNAGDLSRSLTENGVRVERILALPDDLDTVRSAFMDALGRVDLIVSTGGLGPTPDDLTREAIAAVCGETPIIDPELEVWLRGLWSRRNLPFVDANLKQAWLIPSAEAIPNPNGTAPGWWVHRPDGRIAVALPGPPREMRPMWFNWVMPRLAERGMGREGDVRTLRTIGIGESLVVDRLGEELMSRRNPAITTYARQEAVDVRIAAQPEGPRTAAEIADEAEAAIMELLGEHVWGRGDTTWADAIDTRLAAFGWTLATVETGTSGTLAALFASSTRLRRATVVADASDLPGSSEMRDVGDTDGPLTEGQTRAPAIEAAARWALESGGADVGLAVRARYRDEDTAVTVSVVTPRASHSERRIAFLGGAQGRQRAAVTAAAILHATLLRIAVDATSDAAGNAASGTASAATVLKPEVHR